MSKSRSTVMSLLALILAAAAFVNSLLPHSPLALGAPNRQDAPAHPTAQAAPVIAAAAVVDAPRAFNYQGILRKPDGTLENGTFNMTLRLWDAVLGGNQKFVEPHDNVIVRDGVFEVILGDKTPIDPSVLAISPLFLGITVSSDVEMQPRQRVNPVPVALTLVPGATIGGNLYTLGNVGVGTTNPRAQLHVAGQSIIDGALHVVSAGRRVFIGGGGAMDVKSFDSDLYVNAVGNHSLRLNTLEGEGASDVVIGNPSHAVHIDGRLTMKGHSPILVRRYYNFGDEARIHIDGVDSNWRCVATSWSTGSYQDADSTIGVDIVWTYSENGGNDWYVEARFDSEGPHENSSVEAVCFRNEIVDYAEIHR